MRSGFRQAPVVALSASRVQRAITNVWLLALLATTALAGPASAQADSVRIMWPPVWGDTGFGIPVYPAGDINQDGVPDLAVGAVETDGGGPYVDAGRAYIYSGATLLPLVTFASPEPVPSGRFGAIRPFGRDLNADGIHDYLVEDPGAGQFRSFSGATGALIRSYPREGNEVASIVGDVNGDGLPDLALGDPTFGLCSLVQTDTRGRIRLLSGSSGQLIQSIEGGCPAGRLGTGIRGLGDLTGDGRSEFAALANNELRLYDGATRTLIPSPATSFNPAPNAQYTPDRGSGVLPYAAIPDRNGDGVVDLVIARMDLGQIGLYSGADRSLLRSIVNPDVTQYGAFGRGVLDVGDFTGDGIGELGVSAVLVQQDQNGVFLVIDGSTDAVLARMTAAGPDQWWMFANHVALPGDLDGDGVPDFVFGVATRDQAFLYSGASFVTVAAEGPPTQVAHLGVAITPNPVRGRSHVRFEVPAAGVVRLTLRDVLGRTISLLEDGVRPAGRHDVPLATDRLTPGTYIVQLEANGRVAISRITVLR